MFIYYKNHFPITPTLPLPHNLHTRTHTYITVHIHTDTLLERKKKGGVSSKKKNTHSKIYNIIIVEFEVLFVDSSIGGAPCNKGVSIDIPLLENYFV